LAARSEKTLKKLEKEIPNSFAVATDMRKPADIKALVKKTLKKFDRIDILINNAGQGMRSPVESIDLKDYKDIMELNVFAVVRAMQAVIPVMRAQGGLPDRQAGGLILNISSMVTKNFFPGLAAYASTKYALNAITFTARTELEPDHISVSAFHPKMTSTGFGQNALGEKYLSSTGRPGMTVDTPEAVALAIAIQIESDTPEANM